jgi:hypothetical protein
MAVRGVYCELVSAFPASTEDYSEICRCFGVAGRASARKGRTTVSFRCYGRRFGKI